MPDRFSFEIDVKPTQLGDISWKSHISFDLPSAETVREGILEALSSVECQGFAPEMILLGVLWYARLRIQQTEWLARNYRGDVAHWTSQLPLVVLDSSLETVRVICCQEDEERRFIEKISLERQRNHPSPSSRWEKLK